LIEYTGVDSYGVTGFLEIWKTDAVSALDHIMGDRDSYSGFYLHQLVDSEHILLEELEQACLAWLNEMRYIGKASYRGFDDVISVSISLNLKTCLEWIVLNFDELLDYAKDDSRDMVINAACAVDNISCVWERLRDILWTERQYDTTLFSVVYVKNRRVAEVGEIERYLQKLCRLARVRRRSGCFDRVKFGSLYYMLLERFGCDLSDESESIFHDADARALAWLKSQAAYSPFPVKRP